MPCVQMKQLISLTTHLGQDWNTTRAPGLIIEIAILLVHANHDCQRLCKDLVWQICNVFLRLRLRHVDLDQECI